MRIILIFFLILFSWSHLFSQPLLPSHVSEDRLATEIIWQGVRKLEVGKRPKIVLVLGGGGARGLAHIGVLRAFQQEGIPIDQIVGISVGSLIGALYAGGVSTNQLENMASEVGWNSLTDVSRVGMLKLILSEELLSTKRMEEYLDKYLGKKKFSDLDIPFSCIATDIQTGDRVVFDRGRVSTPARASATIPGLFKPVQYKGKSLVDGGLVDVLPTDLVDSNEWALIVAVLPSQGLQDYKVGSVLATLVRSIEIQKDVIVEEKKKLADFVIEPNTGSISILDLAKNQELIQIGTQATRNRALDFKKMIIQEIVNKQKRQEDIGER